MADIFDQLAGGKTGDIFDAVTPPPAAPPKGVPGILAEEPARTPTIISSKRIPEAAVIPPVDDRSDARKFLETPLISPRDIDEAMPFLVGPFALQKGLLKGAAGMTSPENAAIVAGTGGLGMAADATTAGLAQAARVAQSGLSAYFATQAGKATLQSAPEVKKRWDSGDWQGALEVGGQTLLDAAITAASAAHSVQFLRGAKAIGETARKLQENLNAEEAASRPARVAPKQITGPGDIFDQAAPKPDIFDQTAEVVKAESPIEGGSLYKYTKRTPKSKPVPEAQTPAVVPPQQLTSEISTPEARGAVAAPAQALDESGVPNASGVGGSPHRLAGANQELGGLDVPGRGMVLEGVVPVAHNPQIGDGVVQPVPVDVVNDLPGHQGPPKVGLHDQDVLGNAPTVEGGVSVPLGANVANPLANGVAGLTAKTPLGSSDLGGLAPEGAPALVASEQRHTVRDIAAPAGSFSTQGGEGEQKQNAVVPVNPPSKPEEARGTGQKQNTEAVAPEQKQSWQMTKAEAAALFSEVDPAVREVVNSSGGASPKQSQLALELGKLKKLQTSSRGSYAPGELRRKIDTQIAKIEEIKKNISAVDEAGRSKAKELADVLVSKYPDLFTRTEAFPFAVGTAKFSGLAPHDHARVVRAALESGKPVPPEVLADYPDLAPKPQATEAKPPDGGAQPTPKGQWIAEPDGFPNEKWTIRNTATGETLKTDTTPGFYRSNSQAKAERDAAKLNQPAKPNPLKLAAAKNTLKAAERKAKLKPTGAKALKNAVSVLSEMGEAPAHERRAAGQKSVSFPENLGHDIATLMNEGKWDLGPVDTQAAFERIAKAMGKPMEGLDGLSQYSGLRNSQYDAFKSSYEKHLGSAAPEPLQARPIEGPTYRPTMPRAQKVATASLQPIRVGRERNPVLSANAQVMDLLHEALGIPDTDIPGATFTAPQVEEILRKVSQERRTSLLKGNKEAAAKWGELRDALEQNRAMVKGGPMVVYAEKSALSEELNHATQLKATGDQYLNHLGVEGTRSFLAANSLGERAATNLMSRFGYSENAPAMVLEIGARLMEPGRYKEMGLSLDEANTLRDQYERLLIERHGVERISKISERLNSARKKDNGVQYERGITTRPNQGGRDGRPPGTLGRSAVQDARRAEGKGNGSPAGGEGGLPPVRGDKALQGRPPERRGTEPLQSRSEGPRFKKQESRLKQAADVPKSVRERIKQEGPAGVEVMRKIDRADTVGTVFAGKRVDDLIESGIEKLTRRQRFGSNGSLLDMLEDRAPITGEVGKTASAIKRLFSQTAGEARAANIKSKRQVTVRPEDPLPAGAKLTRFQQELRDAGKRVFVTYKKPFQERSGGYAPHVIPASEALQKGKLREDVIDNMVHIGAAPDTGYAEAMLDEYRKFVDEGGRAKLSEKHLIDSGQARDASEARALMARIRKKGMRRQGSLEYSRIADLPFYDPDMLRVLPNWLAATSMRLAEVREFRQNGEEINKLIHRIEAANGNHAFVRAAVDRGLKMIRDGDTGDEQVARFITTLNGFRLSLSFIQNSTQGVLNTLLHTHDPILTAKAFAGSFTKEGRRFAARSGASLEGMINEMVRSVGRDNSALGKALEQYLGVTFTPSEKQNRITAAIAGKLWAEKMLRRLKINPKDELARQELAAMGLSRYDVLLKLGKVDGDAALVAGKSFSDLTQFRSRVWDMMNFSTKSSLGRMMSQFKNYGYQQFRLAYRDSIGEIRKGRWGRGAATILILAAVFPMAGEVVADIRSLISGRKRPTRALDRYLEDIAAGSALGIVADTLQGGMARRGAETIGGPPVSVGGQALDTLASFRGDRAVTEKLKGFGKGITKLVLGFFGGAGTAISNRVLFPPREAQSSDSRKLNRKLRKLK